MNSKEKIKEIIEKNNGYITRKNLDVNNINSRALAEYAQQSNLKRVSRGFYAIQDWLEDDLLVFQYKYPKYIFSYQTALYLHKLTERIPFEMEVTRTRSYNPGKIEMNVVIKSVSEKIYLLGIIEKETPFGNLVKVYDQERTICDIIRDRANQDAEIFSKAIKKYNRSNERNLCKLMKYASEMGIREEVDKIFEVIAYED